MRERFQLPVPFWRMQYQLLGGRRKVWFLAVIYTAVVIVGAVAFQRIMKKEQLSQVCAWIVNGLMAIQIFLIIVGGSNALHRALLRDYETKMTESHRITPMSNIGVVLGYMVGANLQIFLLFAITILIGLMVSAIGQAPIGAWFVGNMLLLCAASTVWAAVVFAGMRPEKPISPSWIIACIAGLGVPIAIIPGTGLMLGVYTVFTAIAVFVGRVSAVSPIVYVIAGVSLVFTAFWLEAAAAKYRRPDLPAMNGARGLALLVLWLTAATGGMIAFQAVTRAGLRLGLPDEETHVQWIGTLIATMLFITVATLGATDCRLLVRGGRQARGWGDRLPDIAVAVVSATLSCAFLAALGKSVWIGVGPSDRHVDDAFRWSIEAWIATAAALLLTALTARALHLVMTLRFRPKSPLVITWTMLILLWALPGADALRANAMASFNEPLSYSLLSTISPAGVIAVVWTHTPAPIWAGLVCQTGLLVALMFFGRTRRTAVPA